MDNPAPHKISIIIVSFNNESTIGACLDSLITQTFKNNEILIWDNHSADSTIAIIKQFPNVHVTQSPKNLGFARAVNSLSQNATGEYLFILNPDCVCPLQALDSLRDFAETHSGAISPALVNFEGAIQHSARQFPDYSNILFSRQSPLFILRLATPADAGYLEPRSPSKVPVVSATALFIRKELFDKIGRFDEQFFMYLEDVDLCRRLAQNNEDIWLLPDLKIAHKYGASSANRSIKPLFYHHISIYRYFAKHYSKAYLKNISLLILLLGGFVISSSLRLLGIRRKT